MRLDEFIYRAIVIVGMFMALALMGLLFARALVFLAGVV